ncbi:MAG TPA: type VI secretion system protein TssL, long form [Methylocella sp.]|nr:type VI secretion system protein TssL, long form [Methylocella sp.]
MSDKDNPFDRLGGRDKTVFRPTPGGRRPQAPSGATPPPLSPSVVPFARGEQPGEEWIRGYDSAPPAEPPTQEEVPRVEELVVPHENPLMQAAGPLLQLLGRLRVTLVRASPAGLMDRVAATVMLFEKEIRATGISAEKAETAKYILCATADDIVQNIPAEERHVWVQFSMLARFFRERIGGVRFFEELDRAKMDPVQNYQLLELMHACLALGFQGIHRTSSGGAGKLQEIQRNLYEILRKIRPRTERNLSPHWRGQSLGRSVMRVRVPFWTVFSAATLLLFTLFLTLRTLLSGGAEVAAADLMGLHSRGEIKLAGHPTAPPPEPPPPPPNKLTQLQRIRLALAPEIAAGKVDATQTATKIKIIVSDLVPFDSGQATLRSQFLPIAKQIAETLEKEPGAISVIGHTDNVKLSRTSPFSSNWQLSMERAKAVANVLRLGLSDPSRIEIDGRADYEPLASNDTAQGRAQNRRVEIMLARSD